MTARRRHLPDHALERASREALIAEIRATRRAIYAALEDYVRNVSCCAVDDCRGYAVRDGYCDAHHELRNYGDTATWDDPALALIRAAADIYEADERREAAAREVPR